MRARLDVKRWVYASIAAFVVYSILEYISIQFFFKPSYPDLFPAVPEDQSMVLSRLWTHLGRAIFSVMFAFIYTRGYEGKAGIGEGLRYGIWVAILVSLPLYLKSLVVSSFPGGALFTGMLWSMVEIVLMGVLVGSIYKVSGQQTRS
jgi:hypothetical protein